MPNNVANVSTGKGVSGGYFFSIPATAENLEKITSGALKTFTNAITSTEIGFTEVNLLGFISEDGWVISEERETDEHRDVNGENILTSVSSRTETTTATLVEIKEESMQEWYGHDNVSVSDNVIQALHASSDGSNRIYIADLVLKGNRRWRYIIPQGQVTEIGDLTIASTELVGREITITSNAWDYNGKTITSIDYIQEVGA